MDLDLETKKKGAELEALWAALKEAVIKRFNDPEPVALDSERADVLCEEIAKELGLSFHRKDDCLCFTDKALALN